MSCLFNGSKLDRDRAMIGRPAFERPRLNTVEPANQTPIQAEAKDVLSDQRGFPRADIFEAREDGWTDGIVVTDHRRRAVEGSDDS